MRGFCKFALPLVALFLVAAPARAQELASVTGIVKDASGGVLPGVTVEASSPALIEKVRTTVTDGNGQYRIAGLPVGTYQVAFSLTSFSSVRRPDVVLTSGFTATVDAQLGIGPLDETVVVQATTPVVDVQNARQATVFTGEDLRDLPGTRNLGTLMPLVPGLTYQTGAINQAGGVCVGGVGVWCSPNIYGFNSQTSSGDTDGLSQGRLMVDGMVLNSASTTATGAIGGYIADLTNAQEVAINLSGALGESETGGTSINIVPRTGGNNYAGNFFAGYTRKAWFDTNDYKHKGNPVTGIPAAQPNLVVQDHDVTVGVGGPVRRDYLWFYSVLRTQGKESTQTGGPFWPNRNAGIWGMNYQPDRNADVLTYTSMWRNANTRLTWQATPRNKFNIFWDEQDTCQDPCDGTVASYVSPEARYSVQSYPNRVAQMSWTNPFTNRLLFEGGFNASLVHYDFSRHRYIDNPQHIPQIDESGVTAGLDEVAARVNEAAGTPGRALRSGSIGESRMDNLDNYRLRLSASYVSGSHNAKIGWEGAFYSQIQNVFNNEPRTAYAYSTPGTTCFNASNPAASTCGNTALHFPGDPFNQARRPVPSSATIYAGPRRYDERVSTQSLYVQDQWRVGRLTLNGALRYDHAGSHYFPTCVGPDRYVAVGYCTPEAEGVDFHNITPRWSLAWDVFGNGKTAVKWNMGKYLAAAGFNDVFNGVNPARRTVNSLTRGWGDNNGNRIADCDWTNASAHTTFGDRCDAMSATNLRRFGTDPYRLDESGDAIGLNTTHCGRGETGIPQAVRDYCARAGQNLLSGWDNRRSEWRFGLGIQREILPRLSGEVTFNQKWYRQQVWTDTIGVGCDLYSGTFEQCRDAMLAFQGNAQYSFYALRAPTDARLPNGGGYLVQGLNDRNTQASLAGPEAITRQDYVYGWTGVDTNFVYRMRGGFRINGGTSTGRSYRDTCVVMDDPNVRQRDGGRGPACNIPRTWQTNIRGSATYTIPWVDVLTSVVFQSRPGQEIAANVTYSYQDVMWSPGSEWRASNTVGCPTTGSGAAPVGCLYGVGNNNQFTTNVLDFGDMWGERLTLADLKFGKNLRFAGKRMNVGVDIYNVLNSDAVTSYNSTYTLDDPDTAAVEPNLWRTPTGLVSPRFAKLTVQFDF